LGDTDGIAHFRTTKSAEIKERAEKARVRATGVGAQPCFRNSVLAAIQFMAARQLKSRDISLTLKSARVAETARLHRHKWIQHLWKGAKVSSFIPGAFGLLPNSGYMYQMAPNFCDGQ
jgi:hypothetical protein